MTLILLIVGFVLLIKGADYFVDGSSGLAKIFKIPSVIIGLTIVALGTSLPEASVSITASLSGSNELSLSNVIGSNIFNLLAVIGISALIFCVTGDKDIVKRDLPVNLIISVILLVMILNGVLSRVEGIILIVLMVLYILVLIKNAIKNRTEEELSENLPLWKCAVFIVVGIAAVILGGNLVVNSSTKIATALGMSENLVGLTIVAIGTSLPELVTSVVATKKGETGLALGNAVGSCIFNILFILGVSALLSPLTANMENIIDIASLIGISLFFVVICSLCKKLTRTHGILCVLLYVAYTAYIIARNYM